jgi:hypothetical protein
LKDCLALASNTKLVLISVVKHRDFAFKVSDLFFHFPIRRFSGGFV